MLDTVYTVETPEGVQLPLRPAGACVRILAYLVDLLIRGAFYIAAVMVLGHFGGVGWGAVLIVFFFIEWLYPVIFEITRGATPGKKQFGLTVVHDDGTPISPAGSMLRNLLRVVDFLPMFYLAGVVCLVLTDNFKRIGDLAGGSIVVHSRVASRPMPVEVNQEVPPLPGLSHDEQLAVITFAERCNILTDERADELASILKPLLGRYPGTPVTVLKKMARALLG